MTPWGHLLIGPHFPSPPGTILSVRNPLRAAGGVDAESMNHIVQYAPFSYETQLRCVTEADYGEAASRLPGIREARGTFCWTGSWYTAFVSVDSVATITTMLVKETTSSLNLLRMMGTDLAVEGAKLVGLRIEMEICVDPDHFRGDVFEALMQVFTSGDRCSGHPGLLSAHQFHVWRDRLRQPAHSRRTGCRRCARRHADRLRTHGCSHRSP